VLLSARDYQIIALIDAWRKPVVRPGLARYVIGADEFFGRKLSSLA
jgi:hypothetical protein